MNANNLGHKDLVFFRVLKTEPQKGEVIALFPNIPTSAKFCQSYMHVGQHGEADFRAMMADSRPAYMGEYEELQAELEDRGYDVLVARMFYSV